MVRKGPCEGLGLRIANGAAVSWGSVGLGCGLGMPSHAEQLQRMVSLEKRGDSHWVSREGGRSRKTRSRVGMGVGDEEVRKAWSRALGRGAGDEDELGLESGKTRQ